MGRITQSAFGEQVITELSPIVQISFEYTVANTQLTNTAVVNGGTVTQADAMAVIKTSATTGSSALLHCVRHFRSRPGQGGVVRFTTLFETAPTAGTEMYVGFHDETGSTATFKNGLAVGFDGLDFGFHRWSNDVKTTVKQDNFNGSGVLATTSPKLKFDPTKLNVWEIRYQFSGGGAIELFRESEKTGLFVLVHRINYANLNIVPSSYNPNYHFIVWAKNGATTTDMVVKSSSFGYFVEGRTNLLQTHQPHASSGNQEKQTVTTEVAIFTIRNKATYAGKTNLIDVIIEGMSTSIEAAANNNLGAVRLVKNTTLGGVPSYADINTTDSVMEIDTAGTTLTGGTEWLSVDLAGKNDELKENLTDHQFIIGPNDTLTLAGLSAASATIDGSILWKEDF